MSTLVISYASWHYAGALRAIFSIAKDYEHFLWQFFSVPLLLRTILAPFQQIEDSGGSIGDKAAALFVNAVMRLTGLAVKTLFISLWLAGSILSVLAALAFAAVWSLLPLLIPLSLLAGITGLFIP